MAKAVRMTYATAAVLHALADERAYGFDIAAATGLRRGTVYPILRRLEEAGMLVGEWETSEASQQEGRPARRYYRLNGSGAELARTAAERYPAAAMVIAPRSGG